MEFRSGSSVVIQMEPFGADGVWCHRVERRRWKRMKRKLMGRMKEMWGDAGIMEAGEDDRLPEAELPETGGECGSRGEVRRQGSQAVVGEFAPSILPLFQDDPLTIAQVMTEAARKLQEQESKLWDHGRFRSRI